MASIEAELADDPVHIPTTTPQPCRLSAAGNAALLKTKNLIPPLNSPTDGCISLPRATKTANSSPTPSTRKMPASDDSSLDKTLLEQIDRMIKASSKTVRSDIASLEASTSTKIDDISSKLSSRLSKAEKDLSQLGTQIAASREEVEGLRTQVSRHEASIPALVEAAVTAKLATAPNTNQVGRRPRQIPPGFAPGDGNRFSNAVKEERYWEARWSLQLWPVAGDDLRQGVADFLTEKLRCPPGRVSPLDLEVERVLARPDAPAQDQVVVKFPSVCLRDEIKSLRKNLSGHNRSVGMQLEPPYFCDPITRLSKDSRFN